MSFRIHNFAQILPGCDGDTTPNAANEQNTSPGVIGRDDGIWQGVCFILVTEFETRVRDA